MFTLEGTKVSARQLPLEVLGSPERLLKEATTLQALANASDRLWQTTDLRAGLQEILQGSITLLAAEKGMVQLLEPDGRQLTVAAHVGLERSFLERFRVVTADDESGCGRALRTRARIVIPDVDAEPSYRPFLDVARLSRFRALLSIPLLAPNGALLGVLTVHFDEPRVPDSQELALLDLYVKQATAFMERVRQEEQVTFLSRELSHRCKNILTVVEAIAHRTLTHEAAKSFLPRLHALAASHDLLLRQNGAGATIPELVRSQLDHMLDPAKDRIRIDGPSVHLKPDSAQALGIAFHELLTNAGKHGALIHDGGQVRLAWTCERSKAETCRIAIVWTETGGPIVSSPAKTGFGSLVLGRMIEQALNAKVSMEFKPEGFTWRAEWEQHLATPELPPRR